MAKTITVDDSLQKRMAKDVVRFQMTRPLSLVMWGAVTLGVVSVIILAVLDPNWVAENAWLLGLMTFAVLFFLVMTAVQVRRSIRLGMPVGTEVSVSVSDGELHASTALGRSDIPIDQLSKVHLAGSVVMVRPKGSPAWAMIPRATLDDSELAALTAR
jgi:hypothetical protein